MLLSDADKFSSIERLSNSCCCFSTKSTIVTGCCWLLRAERTCCLSFVDIFDGDEEESSCESHADCQRALPGLSIKTKIY